MSSTERAETAVVGSASALTKAVTIEYVHDDPTGQWIVVDDPGTAQVLAVPVSWEHRQLLTREEAADRFARVHLQPRELDVLGRVLAALEYLDGGERQRALRWLTARLDAELRDA